MNRIKILREEANMTQQELANKLNGAKSTVAMYENGSRKPSLDVIIKLSEIFNCSIDYILCKSNIKNPKQSYSEESKDLSNEEIEDALKLYKEIKEKYGNKSNK